jgi:CRISPR/Cas system CMR subunit Cmr4 (Cas7 group RAMP superfamily)
MGEWEKRKGKEKEKKEKKEEEEKEEEEKEDEEEETFIWLMNLVLFSLPASPSFHLIPLSALLLFASNEPRLICT